ncbi:MAG: hypothetical protein ACLQFR_08045 [Streptosporangiaceae bacterium]
MTVDTAAKIDWPAEENYGPPAHPGAAHAYSKGYQAGYEAALADIAQTKREAVDRAIVLRFADILAVLRERAA